MNNRQPFWWAWHFPSAVRSLQKVFCFQEHSNQKLCYTDTYVRCTRLHFWGFTLNILRRTAEVTVQARTGVGTKLGVYIMREQKKQIVEVMWIQLEFVTCCLYIGMICSECKAFQRFYKKMVKSCIHAPGWWQGYAGRSGYWHFWVLECGSMTEDTIYNIHHIEYLFILYRIVI